MTSESMQLDLRNDSERQFAREKNAYVYYCAMRVGDFDTAADVLARAETDPVLERMLQDVDDLLAEELRDAPEPASQHSLEPELVPLSAPVSPSPAASSSGVNIPSLLVSPGLESHALDTSQFDTSQQPSSTLRQLSAVRALSLDVPDAPSWQREAHYSPAAAAALISAYNHIRARRDYTAARHALVPIKHVRMSARQRLHTTYVLALDATFEATFAQALRHLGSALKQAANLDDSAAAARCAYLYASIASERRHFQKADQYFRRALIALRRLGNLATPADITLETVIREARRANRVHRAAQRSAPPISPTSPTSPITPPIPDSPPTSAAPADVGSQPTFYYLAGNRCHSSGCLQPTAALLISSGGAFSCYKEL